MSRLTKLDNGKLEKQQIKGVTKEYNVYLGWCFIIYWRSFTLSGEIKQRIQLAGNVIWVVETEYGANIHRKCGDEEASGVFCVRIVRGRDMNEFWEM